MGVEPALLIPEWPAPAQVRACATTRAGGVSTGPYQSLNLGDHVGDAPQAVAANRARLAARAGLPGEPCWLRQVHGSGVIDAAQAESGREADGSFARRRGVVCAVLSADCLPVLLCDRGGSRVAAAHAGWRGLADGVLEAAVIALDAPPREIMAWLGPAIGPEAFEVGDEVRGRFLADDPAAAGAFRPARAGRWHADLYALAHLRLGRMGVRGVWGGGRCTYREAAQFFSYRRDGTTGRMATLIWLA